MSNRTVTNVIHEGNGYRITWSDGAVENYTFGVRQTQTGFKICLNKDGEQLTHAEIEAVANVLKNCAISSAFIDILQIRRHCHINAIATTQLDDLLTQDTWKTLLFDNVTTHDSSNTTTYNNGVFSVGYGVYNITVSIMLYDTAVAIANLAIDLYDVTDNQEILCSLGLATKLDIGNGVLRIMNTLVLDCEDLTAGQRKRFSVRVRTSTATTRMGADPAAVPAGSTNYVAKLYLHSL